MIVMNMGSYMRKKLAPLFMLLAALCWSVCGVLVKACSWSGLCIAIFRGIGVFTVYSVIRFARNEKFHITKCKLLIALCFFVQNSLLMIAFKFTTAGNATALQNTSPIYILVLNYLILKKKPEIRDILTCVILLTGVFITLSGNTLNGGKIGGDLLALCSGMFYAGLFFCSSISGTDTIDALILGNVPFVFLSPLLYMDHVIANYGMYDLGIAVLCTLVSGIFSWLFFGIGIQYISPLEGNFIVIIEPVMSPVWTFLFLHEIMASSSIAGLILVIITLVFYNLRPLKK